MKIVITIIPRKPSLSTLVHKFANVLIGKALRLFTPFRVTYVVILRHSRRIYSL